MEIKKKSNSPRGRGASLDKILEKLVVSGTVPANARLERRNFSSQTARPITDGTDTVYKILPEVTGRAYMTYYNDGKKDITRDVTDDVNKLFEVAPEAAETVSEGQV